MNNANREPYFDFLTGIAIIMVVGGNPSALYFNRVRLGRNSAEAASR